MHYSEALGESWHYFPVIMFLIMLLLMAICIIIFYRRRRHFFDSKWFRQNWSRDWFANCYRTKTVESASDILKKRYAKGEISKEEFDQMKKHI